MDLNKNNSFNGGISALVSSAVSVSAVAVIIIIISVIIIAPPGTA